MRQRHVERQLSAYLDRELTLDEEADVRRHLESCAACREELARLSATKAALRALPERPLPEAFWPDLRRALQERTAAVPQPWYRAWRFRPALALAAAVIVLLVVVPLLRGQIDRLRAAQFGVDLFVREHAVTAASDPLVDRAYLGLLVTDANLSIVGVRRAVVER